MWTIGEDLTKRYQEVIRLFLTNEKAFNGFKNNRLYAAILGIPDLWQAIGFLKRCPPEISQNFLSFANNDTIGGSTTFVLEGVRMSLNTARYIDSINYLSEHFGSLDNLKILEISPAYGGLLHCIHVQWKPASYNIIDLPEAQELTIKHSMMLGHKVEAGHIDADLAISEYGITEQIDPCELTFEHLMSAKNIFLRSNVNKPEVQTKWYNQLRNKFDLTILPEEPQGMRVNRIIIGKS